MGENGTISTPRQIICEKDFEGAKGWDKAKTIEEGNQFGFKYERYLGGIQHRRARDAENMLKAYDERLKSSNLPIQHDFHKALETIRSAKPLTPWHQSMNEHHDNRVVNSNVEVKIAGEYPIDRTAHPLARTKNASVIRNTSATAA